MYIVYIHSNFMEKALFLISVTFQNKNYNPVRTFKVYSPSIADELVSWVGEHQRYYIFVVVLQPYLGFINESLDISFSLKPNLGVEYLLSTQFRSVWPHNTRIPCRQLPKTANNQEIVSNSLCARSSRCVSIT